MTDTAFWKQLDTQNDENAVTIAIASGHYGPDTGGVAKEWLLRREEARSAAALARSEARQEESLSISRKALSNSQLATGIATMAMVLSTIMAIQKVIEWLSK